LASFAPTIFHTLAPRHSMSWFSALCPCCEKRSKSEDEIKVHDMTHLRSCLEKVVLDKLGERADFGMLCCDTPTQHEGLLTLKGLKCNIHKVICRGVTMKDLHTEVLSPAAKQAILDALQGLNGMFKDLSIDIDAKNKFWGVSGDNPLWLRHQATVQELVATAFTYQVPVYLSVLVQLPMITAAFKNFEKVLLLTPGAEEFEASKEEILKGGQLKVEDLNRIVPLCAKSLLGDTWDRLEAQNTDQPEEKSVANELLSKVNEKLEELDLAAAGQKDGKIKALLLAGPTLAMFGEVLRENTKLPVFDFSTLLSFFASGSALSYYHEANVLARVLKLNVGANGTSKQKNLGVVRLDYNYPPTYGDIDHPGTFEFMVKYRQVDGLFFEVAQAGSMAQEIMANMAAAIQHLEEEGKVTGISGDCGFMMHYQCFARYVARTPVFMSSLIQSACLAAAILPTERVLIATANGSTMQPGKDKLLRDSGIEVTDPDRFVIEGLETLDGFDAVANGTKVDTIRVQNALVQRMKDVVARENAPRQDGKGPIRMILFECTELPHFSDAVRQSTGLPVFDLVTCVNYFINATSTKNWNTDTFSPHNYKFWAEHFDKMGHFLKDADSCMTGC